MITLNSLSGGKTSSYIAVNYPADYNVFSLVRTTDRNCLFPDKKLRQIVSDKIGKEFIGTLEEDEIIYTMLDLEQYIGEKIHWVSGKTFDEVVVRPGGKKFLPNKVMRFCTIEMKVQPIAEFWKENINEPIETRIGFRANEQNRAKSMLNRCEEDGFIYHKFIVGKRGTLNKWENFKYQKPIFPLIEDAIYKDHVEAFWQDKPVRFAYMNNCIGCFHRNPILLKHMSKRHPEKYQWFINQELEVGYDTNNGGWKDGLKYQDIASWNTQMNLFDEDFSECDSGYCGL